MPIETMHRYSRGALQALPDALFLFGDNIARQGFGGQARACRGEPNAVGCPTKWRPTMERDAFFADADFPAVRGRIDVAFAQLQKHLRLGGTVVLPADGIGTGLADLPHRAPRIHRYISEWIEILKDGRSGYPSAGETSDAG